MRFMCHCRALLRFDLLKSELECIEPTPGHRHLAFSNILYTTKIGKNVESPLNPDGENSINSSMNNVRMKRSNSISHRKQSKRHRFRKLNDLKLAFSEFYLMLILLKNYQTLNFTGFRKILKKHDKLFETTRGNEWR
jgi:hypothetical protein